MMNEFQQETLENMADALDESVRRLEPLKRLEMLTGVDKILDRLDRIIELMEKSTRDETDTPELLTDDELGLR